jgi:hypothetical protein
MLGGVAASFVTAGSRHNHRGFGHMDRRRGRLDLARGGRGSPRRPNPLGQAGLRTIRTTEKGTSVKE